MTASEPVSVVLVGAGNRADVYSRVSLTHPDKLKIVGVVDPDPVRRGIMAERYRVPDEFCFESVGDFISRPKFADAAINGTMDSLHVKTSIPILDAGYDLLLEKPFAVNEGEMNALLDAAARTRRRVVVCHVLRYTDFYRAIRDHVDSGILGDIITIEMCEHVNYHHLAVSYVRGKWRSEALCGAPMLLAKSCHDIDIMLWLLRGDAPLYVSSFGGDYRFGAERKPAGAGTRCLCDCPLEEECIFSSRANYLDAVRWTQYVWKPLEGAGEPTYEDKVRSLMTDNQYGRCVWDFDRGGNVDRQSVMIRFSSGALGTFSMIGGSAKSERNIHIVGTKGELKGTFEDSRYVIRTMSPHTKAGFCERAYDLSVGGDMIGASGGHGGGDEHLVLDFVDYIRGGSPSVSCATLADSMMSHKTVFRAEQARRSNSVLPIDPAKEEIP